MSIDLPANVFDLSHLRNRLRVFRDRRHAGEILADMLEYYRGSDALVLGIPAGGIPVATVIARQLHLSLDIAVVSKITLPWNSEAGYGAVAFDGTVCLNEQLLCQLGLSEQEVQTGIANTRGKVARRAERLRSRQAFPALAQRPIIVVDDGLASGFTLRTAREALFKAGAEHIIVAVPTGHLRSIALVAGEVDAVYCANIRHSAIFAVADAYVHWYDVSEEEVATALKAFYTSADTAP